MTLVRTLMLAAALCLATTSSAAILLPLDAPDLSIVRSDRTSITLEVHAGPSGAPAGFAVQWLPMDQYQAFGGWPEPPYASDSHFAGVPTLYVTPGTSSFQLGSDQAIQVVIGKLFDETGVVTSDAEELFDGADYAIRVRATATPSVPASAFSPTLVASTQPRTVTDCTVTLGYWKNHPEAWSIIPWARIGEVNYTNAQMRAILSEPARGNGIVSLAHQVIAVKLNGYLGATPPPDVAYALQQAYAMIGSLVIPPVGSGWLAPASTRSLTILLDQFNTGTIGPGHCPDDLQIVPARKKTWGDLKAIYR